MTTAGVDCVTSLVSANLYGLDFIGRYISASTAKSITSAEPTGYHKLGKALILVYEDEAEDALGGTATGNAKAAIARPLLKTVGYPSGLPVYFAVDFSVVGDAPEICLDCINEFAAALDRPPAVYGDVNMCTYAYEHGIKYLWQFGTGRAPGICIWQGYPAVTVSGFSCDPDTAYVSDYGQWSPISPVPSPVKGDKMQFMAKSWNGTATLMYDVGSHGAWGITSPADVTWYKSKGIPLFSGPPADVLSAYHRVDNVVNDAVYVPFADVAHLAED